ncbi:PAS domain S-box protein [Candidatus Pacearchaeota archaeon]|nr:PAS domain S-box protein [Candidatus Pacearchaeota archaeon]
MSEDRDLEKELLESEEKYKSFFDNAQVGIFRTRISDAKIIEINKKYANIAGYSTIKECLDDFNILESYVDFSKRGELLKILEEHGKVDNFETQHIRRDGSKFWIDFSAQIYLEQGYLEGVLIDITGRKQAEEDLKLFKTLVSHANDAIYLVDPITSQFLDVNDKACEDLGYAREELMRMRVRDIDSVTPEGFWESHIEEVRKRPMVFEGEHKRKDGSVFPVELSVRYVPVKEKDYMIAVVRDMTTRKQAEEEKKTLEAQLRQSQKMESIGTLAGGIAHDFNNILFPIMGYAEMSLDNLPEDSPIQENLTNILQGSKRARDLVQQILTFSRQDETEREPTQLTLIAKDSLDFLRKSLPTTIEIYRNIHKVKPVIANYTQMQQVIINLVKNAANAMDDKGRLDFELQNVELDADFTEPNLNLNPGPHVKLSLRDTGHGISKEIVGKIFDPFYTTKERGEGTGLGLSVVHGIVKSHGGDIAVYSEPGKGTNFTVYFPTEEGETEEGLEKIVKEIPTGNERILLVDDDPKIVDMSGKMLGNLGYNITARTSSVEALELFKTQPEKYELVITDMTMPDMAGDELAEELMKIRPGMPVVLCTGFSRKIDEERAKSLGIKAFLMKPFVKGEIAEIIRDALDSKKR